MVILIKITTITVGRSSCNNCFEVRLSVVLLSQLVSLLAVPCLMCKEKVCYFVVYERPRIHRLLRFYCL